MNEFYKNVSSLSVDLTEGCNLNCSYCFTYSQHITKKIDVTKFKKCFNEWIESTDFNELYLSWWGGEPFVEFKLMVELTNYVNELISKTKKTINYNLTTNGTIINDEIMKWVVDNKVKLLFSCDGVKTAHDMFRKYKDGRGSWDKVYKNMKLLQLNKVPFDVRASISIETIPYFFENFKFFVEDIGINSMAFSPVAEGEWRDEKFNLLEAEIDKCIDYIVDRVKTGHPPTELFHINLQTKDRIIKKSATPTSPCGAGTTFLGVGVDGTIWPCHRFNKHGIEFADRIKNPNCLGYYKDNLEFIEINKTTHEKFNNLKGHYMCSKCENCQVQKSHNCNGFCTAINWDFNKNILTPTEVICKYQELIFKKSRDFIVKLVNNNINLSDIITTIASFSKENNFGCYCYQATYSGVVPRDDLRKYLDLTKRIILSSNEDKTEEELELEKTVLDMTLQLVNRVSREVSSSNYS